MSRRCTRRGDRSTGHRNRSTRTDRGQAYTLEGFAAAAIVLMALLFAMQSMVITPGTGGAVDRTAQAQVQQEAQDALVVAAHADGGEGNLSELVRYWAAGGGDLTHDEAFLNSTLGYALESHVAEPAYPDGYLVQFTYLNESADGTETVEVAGTNLTDPNAVTASYTVPLFEYHNTTAYDESTDTYYDTGTPIPDGPIPDERDGPDDPVHNVVEVRVIAW